MARGRTFRGRGISDSQRRKKSWIQITGPTVGTDGIIGSQQTPNMNLQIPGGGTQDTPYGLSIGLVSDPILDKVPAESTILRIRGSVNLPKNQLTTIESENFAIGIGVMESTAAALGAFPNPATPEGGAWDGWMWYRSQQTGALDANASLFDVKSMRKVQSGQSIIVVAGVFVSTSDGSQSSNVAVDVGINMRALILLP